MGATLREVVFDIGGGVPAGRQLKAVQTGGPAGGVIPADMIDLEVDFDTLGKVGSIMGSGGMIVMDEDDCMVDIARYFLAFTQAESCGKCTFCRVGSRRMLETLERITAGEGQKGDIESLQHLAANVAAGSLCGLGQTAPNPVLTTVRYFRDEYLEHIEQKRCRAGKCKALLTYRIDPETCVGCTLCRKACPVDAVAGEPKLVHSIDGQKCVKCGRCFDACKFGAVVVE
ncbi:MAG: NADH-ubiquinone oxidoreductase-F iron-sulfur binding region domain-containing protein, partial [Planctomycetota bacterium]